MGVENFEYQGGGGGGCVEVLFEAPNQTYGFVTIYVQRGR